MVGTVRYTPPPRSTTSNTTSVNPDLAFAANSDPRRLLGTGGMSSRSVIAARVDASLIGAAHELEIVPPHPAVSSSRRAFKPSLLTVPETSPPQGTLGR